MGEEELRLESAIKEILNLIGNQLSTLTPARSVGEGGEPLVTDYYLHCCPLLRLVTGLCEGADALAARVLETVIVPQSSTVSKHLGTTCLETELAAVLPFSLKDYRKSRPVGYLNEFERQLASCAWVLELDGIYDKPDSAILEALPNEEQEFIRFLANARRARGYRAQGAFLLRQSDLLIAAANPGNIGKAGGTMETVRAALEFGLLVIFIHTGRDADNIYLLVPDADFHSLLAGPAPRDWKSALRVQVTQLTASPEIGFESSSYKDADSRKLSKEKLSEYFDQPEIPRRSSDGKRIPTYRESGWNWFFRRFSSGSRIVRDTALKPFDEFRDRAADLNRHFTGLYRGAFFLNYVLAIVAVSIAALSLVLFGTATKTAIGHQVDTVAEISGNLGHPIDSGATAPQFSWLLTALFFLGSLKLGIVIFISRNTGRANNGRWNDRAVDFRYLAERLRSLFYLPLAGSFRPPPAAPLHFTATARAIRQSTIDWLFDAIVRSVSPADTGRGKSVELLSHDGQSTVSIKQLFKVDSIKVVQAVRDGWIENQAVYHAGNSRTMHGMHHWIERLAKWLGWSVVAVVLFDLLLIGGKIFHWLPESMFPFANAATPWLIFVSAILPAIVAALGGIRFQAECKRLGERSDVMQTILKGENRGASSTAQSGGHWKAADDLYKRILAAKAEPITDIGSWSHDVLRLAERVATVFAQEAADWSVLYAKNVSDPG